MRTLIVGIDVSQAHNDVGALTETGEVVDRPRRFANDRFGFEEFTEWAAEVLGASEYDRVQIGGEATGLTGQFRLTRCGRRCATWRRRMRKRRMVRYRPTSTSSWRGNAPTASIVFRVLKKSAFRGSSGTWTRCRAGALM